MKRSRTDDPEHLRLVGLREQILAGVAELDRGRSAPLDVAKIKIAGRRRLRRAAGTR